MAPSECSSPVNILRGPPLFSRCDVWTYRDAEGNVALLIFSDAKNKPANLPPGVALYSPLWLKDFLTRHEGVITTVFFDIAGPHPMQADPADILAALAI